MTMRLKAVRTGRSASLLIVVVGVGSQVAAAGDPLGAYAGASVGQSTVKADPLQFSKRDLGWKVVAGIRPIALLGVEVAYVDFGHASYSQGIPGGLNVSARASRAEALGLIYLPIPVPLLDLYGKGGVGRLNYRASSSSGCLACSFF